MTATDQILVISFLLICSAFFSSSETAIFSLNRLRLKRKAEESPAENWFINRLTENPSRLLRVILIGNEVVNSATSVFVAAFCFTMLSPHLPTWLGPLVPVLVATPLLVVVGEILPKAIAIKIPEPISRLNAPVLLLFSYVIRPIQWGIGVFVAWVMKVFFGISLELTNTQKGVDEDTFRSMVDLGHSEGELLAGERELIHRVLELDDISVERLMTPKQKVCTLEAHESVEEALNEVRSRKFSRIPVHSGSGDSIVGILYSKDLLRLWKEKRKSIRSMIRPAFYIQRDKKVSEVLREFQDHRIHIAVVNEYDGTFAGILTMQDILSHLFPQSYLAAEKEQQK